MKRIGAIFGVVLAVAVIVVISIQATARSRTVAAIKKLEATQVDHLMVFDRDWPSGDSRDVTDPEKISALIACLKLGVDYTANHDRQNGFERVIFIEPDLLKIGVYQKIGDNESVIVKLGKWKGETSYVHYGYLRCPADPVWKEL
ncbi:MAG: hypothetical protein ACKVJU_23235 [Verrucomicrobiales bacterium]